MKDTYSKIKDNYDCPFNLIDDLIGGKWKLRIVAHIINGDNRFSILQKKIDDITPKVLMLNQKVLNTHLLIHLRILRIHLI
jgi:DNA-binding HxlR family transcriptional regulator